jgi:hypothetical protein
MSKLTEDEIRIRLGIPPKEEFAKIKGGKTLERTTSMLINAVFLSQDPGSRVYIESYIPSCTQRLVRQAQDYARRVGLDGSNILALDMRRRTSCYRITSLGAVVRQ